MLFILVIFGGQPSNAQPTFSPQNKSMLRMDSQESCWQTSDLALTEAQIKTLENLQRGYSAEAMPLRRELMSLRFELRYLIRDSYVQSKILLDRQKKISEVQAKLDSLSLSYQVKARSILTKEQFEHLPQGCSLEFDVGFGMVIGIGRGPRTGFR
jgi:Spy/CpxP family protein refolding chaperone